MSIQEAGHVLGISRNAAYAAASRYRETGVVVGLSNIAGLEVVGMAILLGALAIGACLWFGAQLASLIWSQDPLNWDSTTVVESLIGTVTDHRGDPAQALSLIHI